MEIKVLRRHVESFTHLISRALDISNVRHPLFILPLPMQQPIEPVDRTKTHVTPNIPIRSILKHAPEHVTCTSVDMRLREDTIPNRGTPYGVQIAVSLVGNLPVQQILTPLCSATANYTTSPRVTALWNMRIFSLDNPHWNTTTTTQVPGSLRPDNRWSRPILKLSAGRPAITQESTPYKVDRQLNYSAWNDHYPISGLFLTHTPNKHEPWSVQSRALKDKDQWYPPTHILILLARSGTEIHCNFTGLFFFSNKILIFKYYKLPWK